MKLGEKIKYLRIRKGYSQRELARQAGVSSTTVYFLELEKAVKDPHPNTLKKIADALGISIDDLIEEESKDLQKVS